LAWQGIYQDTDAIPPRLFLVLLPLFLVVFYLGFAKRTANIRAGFDLERLHYLHIVRIFVEVFFLYGLYELGYVAKEVTFAGNNYDIVPGVTAPIIALLVWRWQKLDQRWALYWNFAAMLILLFTISQAILSAPFPFQQLSLAQPTVAPLYFPFIWLPVFVAPLVILAHCISIRRLLTEMKGL
ncbi:MAG: hypothetical protein AAGA62_15000, partial [Bacteroidota bacterium]